MGDTAATVFGDVLGGGTVNSNDVKAVKKFVGKKLPKLRNITSVALERALAREGHAIRHHQH